MVDMNYLPLKVAGRVYMQLSWVWGNKDEFFNSKNQTFIMLKLICLKSERRDDANEGKNINSAR